MDGGTLEFVMGSRPNKSWASLDTEIPVSLIEDAVIVAVPYIDKGVRTFTDSNAIALKAWDAEAKIYYTLDGSEANENSTLYRDAFTISESMTLRAIAVKEAVSSKEIKAEFTKTPKGRSIQLFTEYGSQYSAGGYKALIDHLKGAKNYMTGSWQGYQGVDIEVVVDLNKRTDIKGLSIGFLQDWNPWIFMPESVDYYASIDGKISINWGAF